MTIPTDFTSLVSTLPIVRDRAGLDSSDTTKDQFITDLLTLSAGVDVVGKVWYRAYFVAAQTILQNPDVQTLRAANGVDFTGQKEICISLMQVQIGFDIAKGLTVPPGYEARMPLIARPNQRVGSVVSTQTHGLL